MAKFLGFKQVTLAEYNQTPAAQKLSYLWFVRDLNESGETLSASIYLGTREYGNLGASEGSITIDNLVEYIPQLEKNPDGTFSLDYSKLDYDEIASNIDYSKIPGMSAITERVDTVYEAIFPEEESGTTLMDRVALLEEFKESAEDKLLPMHIDTSGDDEPLV